MDVNKIPVMNAIRQRMAWLNKRQRVLSQNIANADTPNYKPRDLKEQSFSGLVEGVKKNKQGLNSVSIQTTHPSHISGQGSTMGTSISAQEVDASTFDISLSKNGVSLEDEMIKMADTQMEYQTMVSLYRKHTGMIKTAIGRSN